jgi:predicted HTH domain antitoxin
MPTAKDFISSLERRETSTKRSAAINLLRHGLVTRDEAADLASTSRQVVQDWALREGIDIATTRAIYLLKIWHSQLVQEREKAAERAR